MFRDGHDNGGLHVHRCKSEQGLTSANADFGNVGKCDYVAGTCAAAHHGRANFVKVGCVHRSLDDVFISEVVDDTSGRVVVDALRGFHHFGK